jgi:hypothetical protein
MDATASCRADLIEAGLNEAAGLQKDAMYRVLYDLALCQPLRSHPVAALVRMSILDQNGSMKRWDSSQCREFCHWL